MRTHKPLGAVAVVDSPADHHSPAGMPAEAAEGSNLVQAVPLTIDSLISDTGTIKNE